VAAPIIHIASNPNVIAHRQVPIKLIRESVVKANTKTKGDNMTNKFDELAKNLAQSVTRREAFKKFGFGLAGMVLACFGLASRANAGGVAGHHTCGGACTSCGPGLPPCCRRLYCSGPPGGFGICREPGQTCQT
jgi:hypothetical protein